MILFFQFLIIGPPPTVWTISPFCGAWFLNSEKRSRDASRQVIVISHVAFTVGTLQRAMQIVSNSVAGGHCETQGREEGSHHRPPGLFMPSWQSNNWRT